jgi:hypothetical protein
MGFAEELVEDYSPSGAARVVFRRPVGAQL